MPARATRWSLLIVALAFGVALMHTLGHAAGHHAGDRAGDMAMPAAAAGHPHHGALLMAELGAAVAAYRSPAPWYGMDPGPMCLAVLGGLLVLVATRYRDRSRPPRPRVVRRVPRARRWRGPPGRPYGESVAALSVLRI